MTRLVNEADIVNKTRPLFTLLLEMTRLVNETRLLLVPGINSHIYHIYTPPTHTPAYGPDVIMCRLPSGLTESSFLATLWLIEVDLRKWNKRG